MVLYKGWELLCTADPIQCSVIVRPDGCGFAMGYVSLQSVSILWQLVQPSVPDMEM